MYKHLCAGARVLKELGEAAKQKSIPKEAERLAREALALVAYARKGS